MTQDPDPIEFDLNTLQGFVKYTLSTSQPDE